MAGSRKNFTYTDDAGLQFAVSLDESNTEAINGAAGDIAETSTLTVGKPTNLKLREVFYANTARTRTIRCVPLTPGVFTQIVSGIAGQTIDDPLGGVAAGTLNLIRTNGERRRVYPGTDTGQTDGDIS